jgi:RNA polymerase sigma-70 factor (ECF subfamily)
MSTTPGQADADSLLPLARAGDAAALGRLLEAHRNYLELLARVQIGRRLRGKVGADDVVQTTFLEAHRHFAAFRGTGGREFAAWLRGILAGVVANLVRHYLGTRRRDPRLERDLADELARSSQALGAAFAARDTSPSDRAARSEQGLLLADALGRMPDDYREVLVLRHLEGLTFPEVAARLGRSQDSVKKLWTRALDRLRRTLGGTP